MLMRGQACEQATQNNPWAFKGWADVSMRQQRTSAVVSALNLVVAWHGLRDELNQAGRVELGGVMRRLVEVVPDCLLMALEHGQAEAVKWLLELGEVQGRERWALGGEVLDVNVFRRWLVGCGLDSV